MSEKLSLTHSAEKSLSEEMDIASESPPTHSKFLNHVEYTSAESSRSIWLLAFDHISVG